MVHTDLNPQSQDSNLSFKSEPNFYHNYQSSFDTATSDISKDITDYSRDKDISLGHHINFLT